MELLTLLGNLETNLTREIVSTNYGDTVSYTSNSSVTVTINSTSYLQVNRLCLISNENVTNMYISSYNSKKIVKINISDINSISIT